MPITTSGVLPVKKDHRDYSYPRTFGAVAVFPASFSTEWKKSAPDQNADGLPNGCTGYTQSELCRDEDQAEYDPDFTYDWTRRMDGKYPEPVGCDMRTSLSSLIVYGAKRDGETDAEALTHRRGAFYNVIDSPDLDAFDDVRSALLTNKRSVSIATPWFPNWNEVAKDGILPLPAGAALTYHNWKACGWEDINGEPYLIGKPWAGKRFGDKGYVYFSRAVFNATMGMPGTGAFTVRKAEPGDYARIKLALLSQVLSYYRMLLTKYLSGLWN